MILVSIIVPIHNAGSQLRECLDSLINQTLRDIEIICVLDCPTDGSVGVVKEYAKKDKRIVVIENTHNEHISESRNKGISIAKGEYIGFSDHDDTRFLDMYQSLYFNAKTYDSDIVYSNSYINYTNKNELVKYLDPTSIGIIKSIILPMHIEKNKNKLSKSVWASLYRKSFIDNNKLSFKDRRVYYEEDTLFNLNAFLHTENIVYCNREFYIWNKLTVSESSKPIRNLAEKQVNFLNEIINILIDTDKLFFYNNEFKTLISDWIWRKENYYNYKSLSRQNKKSLLKIFKTVKMPLFGMSEETKVLSKKRLRFCKFYLSTIFS